MLEIRTLSLHSGTFSFNTPIYQDLATQLGVGTVMRWAIPLTSTTGSITETDVGWAGPPKADGFLLVGLGSCQHEDCGIGTVLSPIV